MWLVISAEIHSCIISFNTTSMYMLNVLLYIIEIILSFLPLCLVLVYHEYTNANIGPW